MSEKPTRTIARSTPQLPSPPKRPHNSKSVSVLQGIRQLDEFGFSSEAFNPSLPAKCAHLMPADPKNITSVHVSDLWSRRQQRLFLHKTGLQAAEYERERKQRRAVYLAQRNQRQGSHVTDELYDRLTVESNPSEAVRCYAAGREGMAMKQLRNLVKANQRKKVIPLPNRLATLRSESTITPTSTHFSMKKLEELFHRCDDTLTRTQTSKQYNSHRLLRHTYTALHLKKRSSRQDL